MRTSRELLLTPSHGTMKVTCGRNAMEVTVRTGMLRVTMTEGSFLRAPSLRIAPAGPDYMRATVTENGQTYGIQDTRESQLWLKDQRERFSRYLDVLDHDDACDVNLSGNGYL